MKYILIPQLYALKNSHKKSASLYPSAIITGIDDTVRLYGSSMQQGVNDVRSSRSPRFKKSSKPSIRFNDNTPLAKRQVAISNPRHAAPCMCTWRHDGARNKDQTDAMIIAMELNY